MDHSRRSFLKTSAVVTAGLAAAQGSAHASGSDTDTAKIVEPINTQISAPGDIPLLEGPARGEVRKGNMIYRPLGTTGEMVSLIGMGGFHLGKTSTEEEAIRLIHAAVDSGITFMDNCWDYNLGTSELRAGKAYKEGGYRDKIFLMTKIDGRTKKAAARQIDESLARLQTDHIDLVQHHEIIRMEDPDSIFKEDGAMAAFLEARLKGKLRSFSAQVLPVLLREKIAPLAMKTFGDHFILDTKTADPIEMLHFSMSLPVAVVITGIDKQEILDQALAAVKTYQPMDKAAVASLLGRTRAAANKGESELYKTTWHFDGTAQNPDWLGLKKEQNV